MDDKMLAKIIKDNFNNCDNDDPFSGSYFEDTLCKCINDLTNQGFNALYSIVNEGKWVLEENDECQNLENALVKITINDRVFFATIEQGRSGYGEFFYDPAQLTSIVSEDIFNQPKTILEFNFKNKTIFVFEDKKAKIGNIIFESIEKAILSLEV